MLEILPRLVYLDTVQLMEEDRKVVDSSVVDAAVLVFTCHRITGLKPPPKEVPFESQKFLFLLTLF